jgi:2-oxoglutarate ferredoxin oxidoreductase subunit alpha
MPELGRVFLQAESEIAAINMVYGAACAGVRTMTSSSSPGISLMQEGFSYIAASDLPCVVVDIMRGGPGLGNILPSQGDYFQVTRSAGHGDYHPIVLAPASVQEAVDLTVLAFELADQYRHLVIIAADGLIGQMMEPAELPPMRDLPTERPAYALTGAKGRPPRRIASFYLQAEAEEAYNLQIQARLARIREREQRSAEYFTEDARFLVVGYGSAGRIALSAVQQLREQGVPVGLFRPITLYPFPETRLRALASQVEGILVVEMNAGQMLEDVRLVVAERVPIHFYGRMGGAVPMPEEIVSALRQLLPAEVLS